MRIVDECPECKTEVDVLLPIEAGVQPDVAVPVTFWCTYCPHTWACKVTVTIELEDVK